MDYEMELARVRGQYHRAQEKLYRAIEEKNPGAAQIWEANLESLSKQLWDLENLVKVQKARERRRN